MRTITLSLLCLLPYLMTTAQKTDGFKKVDKFKIHGLSTSVYFKDPLIGLVTQYPDFDSKANQKKHELLDDYLHHSTLYIFETEDKTGSKKLYELKGNPNKVRTKYYFDLSIVSSNGVVEKTVDKVNTGGSFFEHMAFFQSAERKEMVGKGLQIWGYFVFVEPYEKLKEVVTGLIKMDSEGTLPEALLAKPEVIIEPMFAYQRCGLQAVKKRTSTVTVYQYDSLGKLLNAYPRTEVDSDLYHTSISKDLGGVTNFPFFSINDKKEVAGNVVHINSSLPNIQHYLKNIKVTLRPNSEEVEKIEGTLIIHGYSAEGHSTYDELYLAQFEKVGSCWLPKTIKFSPLSDPSFQRPRIVTEILYELNQ